MDDTAVDDENIYDINGEAVTKLEHSSGGRHTSKSREEEVVVGLENEVETLLRWLEYNGGQRLEIISINGAAGGGKTTLAREVYWHPLTSYTFGIRAWVSVSQEYNKTQKRDLLIPILKSALPEEYEDYAESSVDSLGEKVYKCLKGRKYLIVMDDIWGIEAWNDIQRSFPKEGNGSKVLFTSRLVVQPADSVNYISHCLAPLRKELSWKLLEKKVFGMKECPQELVDIGKQIAEKCEGLPLAIVAIAGILATEDKTLDVWKKVAKHLSSIIAKDSPERCMDILELSYNHLPLHLKACFLYIGGFPEDIEIPAHTLIWLWVAKGFIQRSEEGKSLEEMAKDNLTGLIDRSLVMVAKKSPIGKIKACRIHDLLRILCLKKYEEDKFGVQIYKKGDSISPFDINKHRNRLWELFKKFRLPNLLFLLGAFLVRGISLALFVVAYVNKELIFEFLREVLEKHAIQLPDNIFEMVDLRHLHSKRGVFQYHSSQLSSREAAGIGLDHSYKLDSLQTLHQICTCKDCQSFLARTPNLRKLGLVGYKKSQDGVLTLPNLEFLKCLETLKFSNMILTGEEERQGENTLPTGLKLPLTITQITLKYTLLKWEELSILQTLPSLEVLKLSYRACKGPVWNTNELEGSFQLKYLRFENLDIEEWNASGDQFPRLEVLEIRFCGRLKGIPIDFANLNELREINLESCHWSMEKSAREIQEEQRNTNGDDDCLHLCISKKYALF